MKRFFVAAAAMGLLAGVGAQTWATTCTSSDGASFCQFGAKGCYELSDTYSSSTDDNCGPAGEGYATLCTCEQVLANCAKNGAMYSGVTGLGPDNGYGATVTCAEMGGTKVGAAGPEPCTSASGEQLYCRWNTSCWDIKTDPTGANNSGTPVTSCDDAISGCKTNGYVYTGVPSTGLGAGKQCEGGTFTGEGKDDSPDGAKILCYWEANEYNNNTAYCGPETEAKCLEESGTVVTTCPNTSVKLVGSKAAAPGLKVSYAKNRVTVNWTPSAKLSSGTVQLVNAKGAVLSTAFIKANSSKVTAKLGAVGVPAGMYFVHISAVGQNGQKIVTQSAVSIMK